MADYILGHTGDDIEYKLDNIDTFETLNTSADEITSAYDAKKARCVREINVLVREAGIANAYFRTPTGGMTNHPGEQYNPSLMSATTAEDLVRIGIMARHNPLIYAGMSCHEYTAKINGTDLTVKHSVLENNTWKSWASARGLTIIAAKTGSIYDSTVTGLCENGCLATIIILGHSSGTYIVGECGMQYRRGDNATIDRRKRRAAIYGAFCSLSGETMTDAQDISDFAEVQADSKIGLMCVKLTSNGSLADDMARVNAQSYCWSQNKDTLRGAASTTKVALAMAVSCHFNPYESVTTVSLDDTGGSGLDEEDMPVGSRISNLDALYTCLMRSDNTLANALSRQVGEKLSADYAPAKFTATLATDLPIPSITSAFKYMPGLNCCVGALSFVTNDSISASSTAKVVAKVPAQYAPPRIIPLPVRSYANVHAYITTAGDIGVVVGGTVNNNSSIYIGGIWPVAD